MSGASLLFTLFFVPRLPSSDLILISVPPSASRALWAVTLHASIFKGSLNAFSAQPGAGDDMQGRKITEDFDRLSNGSRKLCFGPHDIEITLSNIP